MFIIQIDLSKCEKFQPTIGLGSKVHNKAFWLLLICSSLGLIFLLMSQTPVSSYITWARLRYSGSIWEYGSDLKI
jgi:hypothetical protein